MAIQTRFVAYVVAALIVFTLFHSLPSHSERGEIPEHPIRTRDPDSFRLPPDVMAEENLKRLDIPNAVSARNAVVEETVVASPENQTAPEENQTAPEFDHFIQELVYPNLEEKRRWWLQSREEEDEYGFDTGAAVKRYCPRCGPNKAGSRKPDYQVKPEPENEDPNEEVSGAFNSRE